MNAVTNEGVISKMVECNVAQPNKGTVESGSL